jgi:hypothetical protein
MTSRNYNYKTLEHTYYYGLPNNTENDSNVSIHIPKKLEYDYKKDHFIEQLELPTNKDNRNPDVWGPYFWFILHNGAVNYPVKASPFYVERMKYFILGIPVMIVCDKCKEHATQFIEKHKSNLDNICKGRETLFNFFVDFHNQVNLRKGKKVLSYREALKLYTS